MTIHHQSSKSLCDPLATPMCAVKTEETCKDIKDDVYTWSRGQGHRVTFEASESPSCADTGLFTHRQKRRGPRPFISWNGDSTDTLVLTFSDTCGTVVTRGPLFVWVEEASAPFKSRWTQFPVTAISWQHSALVQTSRDFFPVVISHRWRVTGGCGVPTVNQAFTVNRQGFCGNARFVYGLGELNDPDP